MTTIYVHTLGDSTLDNLYWILSETGTEQAIRDCVEGQLEVELNKDSEANYQYEVVSHAYDGFTTRSVLDGDEIGRVLPRRGLNIYLSMKNPDSEDMFVQPLEKLTEHISNHSTARHFVIISVGGNDFRENLGNPISLLTSVPQVQQRYLEILERIRCIPGSIRPILMFQYRTDVTNDPYLIYTVLGITGRVGAFLHIACLSTILTVGTLFLMSKISFLASSIFLLTAVAILGLSTRLVPLRVTKQILQGQSPGIAMIGCLMEKFYKPILKKAKELKLPIVDLPNTFDPRNTELYTSGIEPSKAGGALIAKVVCKAVKNVAMPLIYTDKESKVYNPNQWYVKN